MKNFVGIFLAMTLLIVSVSASAEPNEKAYRNANDNASFKNGKNGGYDSLEDRLRDEESRDKKKDKKKGDNDSLEDRLDKELNDGDDWDKKKIKRTKERNKHHLIMVKKMYRVEI